MQFLRFAQLLATLPLFVSAHVASNLEARDSPSDRCGVAFGNENCTSEPGTGRCCSRYGWCGSTSAHCGTGCQPAFGECSSTASSSTIKPASSSTATSSSTAPPTPSSTSTRPNLGSVPYGTDIYHCEKAGTIALTYDDGPSQYTKGLLDILKEKDVKATFFVTGAHFNSANTGWKETIKRAYDEGHQIASHTWNHADMNTLTDAARREEMSKVEKALMDTIGRYPTYMRPPYIRCGTDCKATMKSMGYHVIIWDLNTDDYSNTTPETIQNAKNNVYNKLNGKPPATNDWMSIAHDIHYQTVFNLTAYQIDLGKQMGYSHVTLGDCLNDPSENWYRTQL